MNKYALYYAIKRDSEEADVIEFGKASKQSEFKAKAKEDMFKQEFASKYDKIIIASNYGIEISYKVPFQEAPKKRVSRKKVSEE